MYVVIEMFIVEIICFSINKLISTSHLESGNKGTKALKINLLVSFYYFHLTWPIHQETSAWRMHRG